MACFKFSLILLTFYFFASNLEVSGYCWQPGSNPGFTGTPRIEQLKIDKVRVWWDEVISKRDCADNFLVKFWPRLSPNEYAITELVPNTADFLDVEVMPKQIYQFQAVAREDKGQVLGVTWNKSPIVDFRTTNDPAIISNYPNATDTAPDMERSQVMGLSIEIFMAVVVLALIIMFIIFGVTWQCFCHKKKASGHYEFEREERLADIGEEPAMHEAVPEGLSDDEEEVGEVDEEELLNKNNEHVIIESSKDKVKQSHV